MIRQPQGGLFGYSGITGNSPVSNGSSATISRGAPQPQSTEPQKTPVPSPKDIKEAFKGGQEARTGISKTYDRLFGEKKPDPLGKPESPADGGQKSSMTPPEDSSSMASSDPMFSDAEFDEPGIAGAISGFASGGETDDEFESPEEDAIPGEEMGENPDLDEMGLPDDEDSPMGMGLGPAFEGNEESPEEQEFPDFHREGYGLLTDSTPGRADEIETEAEKGSYVIPADVVSALGEGNTMAGAVLLHRHSPENIARRATGGIMGGAQKVPVKFSGGEFVYSPEQVAALGNGDLHAGATLLDKLVASVRADAVDQLSRMPPPK